MLATLRRHPGGVRVLAAALVATLGVLPVFLLGAVGVLVRAEMGFSELRLGAAVSVYFAAAAVGAVPAGRLAERLGGPAGMAWAATSTGVVMLGVATAWSWPALMGWMLAGGVTNALSQLAANLWLSDAVSTARQGVAFGIKQSAIPAGTLLGGAAVPAIALTLGWRWAFALGGVVAVGVGLSRVRSPRRDHARPVAAARAPVARLPLVVLAGAAAFGAGAATAMAAFVVEYAVAVGVDAGSGGAILALGSLASILTRVGAGWWADRRTGGSLALAVAMMLAGSAAVAAFPLVAAPVALGVITALAYALGWGWPGLFNFTVVRHNRQAPATATGITQVGVYIGGVGGPLLFGLLVAEVGYDVAWWTAAGWLLAAAGLAVLGRRLGQRAWSGQAGLVVE